MTGGWIGTREGGFQGRYRLCEQGDGRNVVNSVEMQPDNYVLPGPGLGGSATGTPFGDDGRPGVAGAPAARPALQQPWGWGLAPARAGEPVDQELTDLAQNSVGYSVRQQDAVRRDQGDRVGTYTEYRPGPYVGA